MRGFQDVAGVTDHPDWMTHVEALGSTLARGSPAQFCSIRKDAVKIEAPVPAAQKKPPRARRAVAAAYARGTAVTERGRLWIENQPPESRKGATVGWVRRYQAADGQLYAVLLSAYFFVTMLPVLLVVASYLYSDPVALAHRVELRLNLHGGTATLFSTVMVGAGEHKLSAVLIAILDLFFFGLGFGRVLQLAHARSWSIDLRKSTLADQGRYAEVLGAMVVGVFLFVLQAKELAGSPSWVGWLLDVGWLALLVAFFVWAPRLLLHHRIAVRDLVPGAVFTVLGLVALRVISSLLLTHWLNWYSATYGAFGIVIALFFWIILEGTILVLAAALSPSLAQRRDLLAARV
jgi:membrane protein